MADMDELLRMEISLPPLPEQRRLASRLREQMAEVERAREAVQTQLDGTQFLVRALLRESLRVAGSKRGAFPNAS